VENGFVNETGKTEETVKVKKGKNGYDVEKIQITNY